MSNNGTGNCGGEDACHPHGEGPCPECESETVFRDGKFGKFYGCSRYPECRGTRGYDEKSHQEYRIAKLEERVSRLENEVGCDNGLNGLIDVCGDDQFYKD